MRRGRVAVVIIAVLGGVGGARAAGTAGAPRAQVGGQATPFDGVAAHAGASFSGWALALQGAAAGSTVVLAFSGVDHAVRVGVQQRAAAPTFGRAMVWAGYLGPASLSLGLYLTGVAAGDDRASSAGAAAVQALALAAGETFALKWATGRPFPLHGGDPAAIDRLEHPEFATEFAPWPPWRARGVAWPSGHTSTAVAMAAALTHALPDERWVPFAGYGVAGAIAAGMLVGDHHWASDIVAGGLIGQAIGQRVGVGFRERRGERAGAVAWVVSPVPGGLMVVGGF